LYYLLFLHYLSSVFCCYGSDAIAFSTNWARESCSTLDVQLSGNEVYAQDCTSLQEALFDDCCVAVNNSSESVDSNTTTRGAPENNNGTGGDDNISNILYAVIGVLGFIVISGLLCFFLMWRKKTEIHVSEAGASKTPAPLDDSETLLAIPSPPAQASISEGPREPLPVDGSEHCPPSAPPTYLLKASDHPPKNSPPTYQPQVIAVAVDLPPAYDSSCLPSHADPPPPYKSDG
jgi:hypothetical protein